MPRCPATSSSPRGPGGSPKTDRPHRAPTPHSSTRMSRSFCYPSARSPPAFQAFTRAAWRRADRMRVSACFHRRRLRILHHNPRGHVVAYELDNELATRALENLLPRRNVELAVTHGLRPPMSSTCAPASSSSLLAGSRRCATAGASSFLSPPGTDEGGMLLVRRTDSDSVFSARFICERGSFPARARATSRRADASRRLSGKEITIRSARSGCRPRSPIPAHGSSGTDGGCPAALSRGRLEQAMSCSDHVGIDLLRLDNALLDSTFKASEFAAHCGTCCHDRIALHCVCCRRR